MAQSLHSRRTLVHYFLPCILLLLSISLIILVRNYSFLEYEGLDIETSSFLIVFYVAMLLGTIIGPICFHSIKSTQPVNFSSVSINRKANTLIFLSLVSICLLVYKFLTLAGSNISISAITEIRLARGRDPSHEVGSMASGVLGMAISGFPVFAYCFKHSFEAYLSKQKRTVIDVLFVVAILTSLLQGGRFAAAIMLLFAYLLYKVRGVLNSGRAEGLEKKRLKSKAYVRLLKYSFLLALVYIFSIMFIDRSMKQGDSFLVLVSVLSNSFEGATLTSESSSFLLNNTELIPFYFVISLFQYYLAHPFFQFQVLFSADYPVDAPYLFAYQFYLHTSLLSKLGFDFVSIGSILSQIPNPGNYFTLAGGYYLDFGYWGSVIAAFLTSLIGSYYWVLALQRGTFIAIYLSILYLILIIFSPVVSIISAGVFPSLLTIAIISWLFSPRRVRVEKV